MDDIKARPKEAGHVDEETYTFKSVFNSSRCQLAVKLNNLLPGVPNAPHPAIAHVAVRRRVCNQ
jgi:hypothetical protein